MTGDGGGRRGEQDLDLIADFAAGLLDGTPEGAVVAERLTREPALAALHAALVHADALVRAELRAVPSQAVPDDVAARLDAAFAAEPALHAHGTRAADLPTAAAPESAKRTGRGLTHRTAPEASPQNASGAGAATVVPLRRRRGAYVAGGAVAAGIALLAGGVFWQSLVTTSAPQASSSAGNDARSAPRSAESAEDSAPGARALATGTEYSAASLVTQVPALLSTNLAPAPSGPNATKAPNSQRENFANSLVVPTELARLRDPAALRGCLGALEAVGAPLAVDYAHYAGKPAVVIVLPATQANSVDVAVVGPDCGPSGSDTQLRRTVPISR